MNRTERLRRHRGNFERMSATVRDARQETVTSPLLPEIHLESNAKLLALIN